MFVYFVRWSLYNNTKLWRVGQLEIKHHGLISSINDIEDVCKEIRKKISSTFDVESGDEILIDFYTLLRKEDD